MEWLNYHHLYYFWITAREGSLNAACKQLRLAPSTVSAQIKSLEESLGQPLFLRRGRGLVLTEKGELVRRYADDIFALGQELTQIVRSAGPRSHPFRLRVGVSNNLPKLVAYRLLSPAIHLAQFPVHLIVHEDEPSQLVAELGLLRLDLVISDSPSSLTSDVKLLSLPLGSCGVSLFGTPALAERYGGNVPKTLDGAPMLLPEEGSAMRRLLEEYFMGAGVRPRVVAEFGDSALLKVFGAEGAGLFPAPSLVTPEVLDQYRVQCLGELGNLREQFFAMVHPAREQNPAVQVILAQANQLS